MRRDRDPRTGPFESALNTGDFSNAQRSLNERWSYWQGLDTPSEKPAQEDDERFSVTDYSMLIAEVLIILSLLIGIAGTALAGFISTVFIVLAIPLFIIAYVSFTIRRASNQRNRMRLLATELSIQRKRLGGICIYCNYDLTGCRDELPIESPVPLGPKRCPECASLWPRVPEPTPDEMLRWHRSWFKAPYK